MEHGSPRFHSTGVKAGSMERGTTRFHSTGVKAGSNHVMNQLNTVVWQCFLSSEKKSSHVHLNFICFSAGPVTSTCNDELQNEYLEQIQQFSALIPDFILHQ